MPDQGLLAFQSQPARRRAASDDQSSGMHRFFAQVQGEAACLQRSTRTRRTICNSAPKRVACSFAPVQSTRGPGCLPANRENSPPG